MDSHVLGGLDLTGEPEYAYSHMFAGAMLAKAFLGAMDMFLLASRIEFRNKDWESLLFFLTFMGMCVGIYIVALLVSIGNASKPRSSAKCRAIASILLLIVFFAGFGALRIWVHGKSGLSLTFKVGIFSLDWILLLTMMFVLFKQLMGSKREEGIVLLADSQRRWGEDDVRGLEQAAKIQQSFYAKENQDCLVGPDMMVSLKGFFYPQCFCDHDRFAQTDKLREVAREARILYPIRLNTAMGLTTALLVLVTIAGFVWAVPYVGEGEKIVQDILPGAKSRGEINQIQRDMSDAQEQLSKLPPLPSRNQSEGKATPAIASAILHLLGLEGSNRTNCRNSIRNSSSLAGCTEELELAIDAQLYHVMRVMELQAKLGEAKEELEKAKDFQKWWGDRLDWLIVAFLVSLSTSGLLSGWFVFVGRLAYRKTLIELALSSPSYPFNPKLQNATRDTRFVAYFTASVMLSWALLTFLLILIVFLCSIPEIWKALFDTHRPTLVAFCIYEAIVLLVVPMVHAKVVLDKDKQLVRPRVQSVLIFVWELFYAPQVVMSILLKAIYALCVAVVMFLRPDLPVLPASWQWLDSLHCTYVSSVYGQLEAGVRRYERTNAAGSGDTKPAGGDSEAYTVQGSTQTTL